MNENFAMNQMDALEFIRSSYGALTKQRILQSTNEIVSEEEEEFHYAFAQFDANPELADSQCSGNIKFY